MASSREPWELPPAGRATGLRAEDYLNVVGQQQWWERREFGNSKPRSVETILSPRHLKAPYGESTAREDKAEEDTASNRSDGLARGFRNRAGLRNALLRPHETEYSSRYEVPKQEYSTSTPPTPPQRTPPPPQPPKVSEYASKYAQCSGFV